MKETPVMIRYLKWLCDSGTAQEIGPDAVALLVAVLTRLDDIKFERSVNFFNEQLATRCGMSSIHALIRARQRCVDADLLEYNPGAKRAPGGYWVKQEYCAQSAEHPGGFSAQSAENPKSKPRIPCAKRRESGRNPQPSIPNPDPNTPNPSLPAGLDQPEFKRAWCDWQRHLKEKRRPVTQIAKERQLAKCSRLGVARAVAAIDYSIENNYQGIFEPKTAISQPRKEEPTWCPRVF